MADGCTLVAKPQPFAEPMYAYVQAGMTVAEMLGAGASEACSVTIGGHAVPYALWAHVRPKAGQVIHVVRYPQGGGGGKLLRSVALIAVAALSVYTVGAVGAIYGTAWGAAAGAAIGIVGNLAINALIPPPSSALGSASSGNAFDQLSSLTGTSNQASPYGAIPCVVGTMVFYPPHASLPYTEVSGDDQYLRMLLDLGYAGPDGMDVSQLQIGGTDISTFEDVEWEIDTAPTLFSQDIYELAVGATLAPSTSTTRTTQAGVTEIALDLIFPNGLFAVDSQGNFVNCWQFVDIEFSVTGSGTWYGVAPPTAGITISNPAAMQPYSLSNYKITSNANKTLRIGIRWKVPANAGTWDVRLTTGTPGWASSATQSNTLVWSVLRSIHASLPSTTGTNKLAVRIKATNQLNGTVSNLSVRVAQLIRTQDANGNWQPASECQNPAWVYLWLMTQCPAVQKRLADGRLSLADILAWAQECTARGYLTSFVMSGARAFYDVVKDVLAAGRATFGVRNGLYAPVRDINQAVPVQMFTPANSWNFQYARTFTNPPDALKVTFTNPAANYQQDVVVVYRPGVTALTAMVFDQLDLQFVEDPAAAAKLGYYHLLNAWLRATQYTWNADVENIVCERGDMVTLGHDVVQSGIAFGYVKSVNGTLVVLDGMQQLDPTQQYVLRYRKLDNTQASSGNITPTITWDNTFVTFDSDTAWDSPSGATTTFTVPAGTTVEAGDLYVLCQAGTQLLPLLVTDVKPGNDLSAQITAVDQALAVYDADTWMPPPFVSQITGQPWNKTPPVPNVLVRIGGSAPNGVGVIHTTGGASTTPSSGTYPAPIAGGCVLADSVMEDGRTAGDVKVGDVLTLADEGTLAPARGTVSYSEPTQQPCVEITTVGGAVLRCSISAPIPTRRGLKTAPNVAGHEVAVLRDGVAAWECVQTLRGIGLQTVQHITCENGCFWAKAAGGDGFILHHNMKARQQNL